MFIDQNRVRSAVDYFDAVRIACAAALFLSKSDVADCIRCHTRVSKFNGEILAYDVGEIMVSS